MANSTLVNELRLESAAPSAAFSLDGKIVAVITQQGAVLFDVKTGRQLAEYRAGITLKAYQASLARSRKK